MKKISLTVILLVLIFTTTLTAFASSVPRVDNSKHVHDISDKLTSSEEKTLEGKLADLSETYNVDMVIAFADTDIGTDVAVYNVDFYNINNFKDDGIIFLVDMNNRIMELRGFGTLHDMVMNNSGWMLDDTAETMRFSGENLYAVANTFIESSQSMLESWIYSEVGFDEEIVYENGEPVYKNGKLVTTKNVEKILLTSLAGGGAAGAIIIAIMLFIHSRSLPGGISAQAYTTSGLALRHKSDRFIGTYTSKTKRAESSSGGGGGTSIGGSSGGRSGGGGSRSF